MASGITHCTNLLSNMHINETLSDNNILKEEKQKECTKRMKFYKCIFCLKKYMLKNTEPQFSFPCYNEKIKCPLCNDNFSSKREMMLHIERHIEVKIQRINCNTITFCCVLCDETSDTKDALLKHLFGHVERKNFKCLICNLIFNRKKGLAMHMEKHYTVNEYLCAPCKQYIHNKQIVLPSANLKRVKKHYSCSICQKVFISKNNLKKHEQNHGHKTNFDSSLFDKMCFEKIKVDLD